jgi:hypothetical protein
MLGLSRKDTSFLLIVIFLTLATPLLLQPFPEARRWPSSMRAIPT